MAEEVTPAAECMPVALPAMLVAGISVADAPSVARILAACPPDPASLAGSINRSIEASRAVPSKTGIVDSAIIVITISTDSVSVIIASALPAAIGAGDGVRGGHGVGVIRGCRARGTTKIAAST